jgi:hypothetical protein
VRTEKEEKKNDTVQRIAAVRRSQWKYEFLRQVIRGASIPLLTPTSRRTAFEPIGSGVLIKKRGHVFICTAQHVLQRFVGSPIFIPTGGGLLVQIEGHGHGNSVHDAGVLHVENKDLRPLLEVALPAGAIFLQSKVLRHNLVLHGYRANQYHRDATTKTVSCPSHNYQLTGLREKAYKRADRSPANHILMYWPNKLLGPNGCVGSHELAGMSGCGVWFVPQVNREPLSIHALDQLPRLVGIFIEQRRDQAMVVATNICRHAEIIRAAYPDLRERDREHYERRIEEMERLESKPFFELYKAITSLGE